MSAKLNKVTAVLLIFLGVYLNIPFSILGAIFDYPQILRHPTGEVLLRFAQGGPTLIAAWYAFALCPVFLIIVARLLQQILKNEHPNLSAISNVAGTCGILAGVFQVLGLIRWVFVVPGLAGAYTDVNATEATKQTAITVFQAFHQYAGVAIGEHLGQLFTALWIILLAAALLRSGVFQKWQGFAGVIIALMMFVGLAEGFATVANFNAGVFAVLTPVAFILLSLWMISLGVVLLMRKTQGSIAV